MQDNLQEKLQILRKALKLNQEEFAKKIGVSRSGYASYEAGARQIQERHIRLILAAFPQVSESWLRYGEGEMLKEEDTQVAAIVRNYSFPDIIRKVLEAYNDLDEPGQRIVLEYAQDLITRIVSGYDQPENDTGADQEREQETPEIMINGIRVPMTDEEIDADVEEYRRQLEAQKKMASSILAGTKDSGDQVG